MVDISELIKQYVDLTEEYTDLSHRADEVKARRAAVAEEIKNTLMDNELDGAVAAGKQVQIVAKKKYTIRDMDAFLALADKYHTDALFSINSNKLDAFAHDLADSNGGELPGDIAASLKEFEYTTLSVRKAK